MDINVLVQILANTFSDNIEHQKAAEENLKKIEKTVPGYHACLLQMITIADIPLPIRQAASLRLKNLTVEFWSIKAGDGMRISHAERKIIKDNILEAIVFQPANVIRVQLLEIFLTIAKFDFPEDWSEILPAIMRNLKSDDRNRVYGGLCTMQMVFKKFQYKAPENRLPVADLVSGGFPVMLGILTHVTTLPPTLETFEMVHIMARTFYVATQLSVPAHLVDEATLTAWMTIWLQLLDLPLPADMYPKDPAHLYRNPLWRAKKWTCQTINRFFAVFGRPKAASPEGKPFANLFFNKFAKPCMAAYMKLLLQHKQHNNVPPRIIQLAYTYLGHCVTLKDLFQPLKPHLRFVILESILPTMCLTPADLQLWKDDPQEFVKRDMDVMEQFHDPRVAATNLLISLVKYRTRDTLEMVLTASTTILNGYAAEPVEKKNFILKDGTLRMIGVLRKLLLNNERLAPNLEPLLITHVFPEFGNPIGFMRARACSIIGQFNKLEWKSDEHHATAIRLVTTALTDSNLPVKLEAAIAVSRLVNEGKIVEFIRPQLQMILEQFFVLMDEIGNEEVVTTLANLIDMFDKEIIPYALVMTRKLAHMFTELLKAPSHDDEAALTAQQCLSAINTILYSVESQPAIFAEIEKILMPVLDRLISSECMEFFDDTLDIIGCLAYFPKHISDFSWSLLPRITGAFFTWAPEYIGNMLPIIDNYISIDPRKFVECKEPNYLEGVLKICAALMADTDREVDCQFVPKMLHSILANCRGMVDPIIPDVMQMLTKKLIECTNLPLRLLVCDAIAGCCYYNPILFLHVCKTVGDEFTQQLFNRWLSHLPAMQKSTHHQKMAVLGLSSLCMTPLGGAPRPLQVAFADILAEVIKVLASYRHDEEQEEAKSAAKKSAAEEFEDDERADHALKDLGEDEDDEGEAINVGEYARKIQKAVLGQAAEELDDSNFESPTDDVDPFIFFATCLQVLGEREKAFYDHWAASLSPELATAVQAHVAEATERQKAVQEEAEAEKAEAAAAQQ